MKKLLFVLAFTFIGGQAFSQLYIVTIYQTSGCPTGEISLLKTDPSGNETETCIHEDLDKGALGELNYELNNIINQGYKLIQTNFFDADAKEASGLWGEINGAYRLVRGNTFIFAIP